VVKVFVFIITKYFELIPELLTSLFLSGMNIRTSHRYSIAPQITAHAYNTFEFNTFFPYQKKNNNNNNSFTNCYERNFVHGYKFKNNQLFNQFFLFKKTPIIRSIWCIYCQIKCSHLIMFFCSSFNNCYFLSDLI
jgi:hypothetical protein